MLNLKKYKTSVLLNTINYINPEFTSFIEKTPIKINYVFQKRLKILRTFIFFNSIFFILMPFNPFIYKSEMEFKLKTNLFYFLVINDDYTDFF